MLNPEIPMLVYCPFYIRQLQMNAPTAQLQWYRFPVYATLCGGHRVRAADAEKLASAVDIDLQLKGLATLFPK